MVALSTPQLLTMNANKAVSSTHHSKLRVSIAGLTAIFSVVSTLYALGLYVPAIAVELVGRAVLPANTFAPGPTSGQLISATNEVSVPFVEKLPVQGFSAVLPGPKPGTFLVLSDNGYGAKANSPDYPLRFYAVEPDFASGHVFPVNLKTGGRLSQFSRQSFISLSDRRNQTGFPIVAEQNIYPGSIAPSQPQGIPVAATIKSRRLLTGADFDLEAFRRVSDGTYWFGDEFGPYLLHTSANGQLLEPPIPLPNFLKLGDRPFIQSPDNPAFANLPTDQERVTAANLPRSGGFEGMALNTSGTKLYALLEKPVVSDPQRDRLLIHEFDLASKRYSGKVFGYRLENPNHAIGDFTAINDSEFIVIERDNRQGDPNNPNFSDPAQFKRLYKVDLRQQDEAGFVKKDLLVDLLNISDPQGLGGNGTVNGRFTFPFVTIEDVLPIDANTLLVINDNNYPFSAGRTPGKPDDSEFILIKLDQPLNLAASRS
ncbi:esterase-like activity of phytase family protein [Trichocoleus desertorum]|uniref:esterase-like activity of phytase family protein n=1 Tax=Trichocoleus desertorum TaxID=1481672 RepID=UPI00329795FE